MPPADMRGLRNFISEIRACKSTDDEQKRINKELANIRQKFDAANKNAKKNGLKGYDKRKYVCKLIFIFLLGNDVEFGHMEAVQLMSSISYQEKQMGYLFMSVLLHETSGFASMITPPIKADLTSTQQLNISLALNCLSNLANEHATTACGEVVKNMVLNNMTPPLIIQKACHAFTNALRLSTEQLDLGDVDDEQVAKYASLLQHTDNGVVVGVASLVLELCRRTKGGSPPPEMKAIIPVVIQRLTDTHVKPCQDGYLYYDVKAPWLRVKFLQILRCFDVSTEVTAEGGMNDRLREVIRTVMDEVRDIQQKNENSKPRYQNNNVMYALLHECVGLVCLMEREKDLHTTACTLLSGFLKDKSANVRYLALDGLSNLAKLDGTGKNVKKHISTVAESLKTETDTVVLQQAVSVLYNACDDENAKEVVGDLLEFLETAAYIIRGDVVLKIAVLAEKNATDYRWYVDVILKLLSVAGDYVTSVVWHMVVKVIVNRQDVQEYAAKTCFQALFDASCHESLVCVSGYVLGEFGHLIANDPNSPPKAQFELLRSHYGMCSAETRSLLVSTYAKMGNLFPELKSHICTVLRGDTYAKNSDTELQQRVNEYLLILDCEDDLRNNILDEMPAFEQKSSDVLQVAATEATEEELEARAAARLAAANPFAVADPSASKRMDNSSFIENFFTANQAVLWENESLQIGAKVEIKGQYGKLTLFYGNRANVALKLSASHFPVSGVDLAEVHPLPGEVDVKKQVPQEFTFTCTSGFSESPRVSLSVEGAGAAKLEIDLQLPIFFHQFLTPHEAQMSARDFFTKWKALDGERQSQIVVPAMSKIDRKNIMQILREMNLPSSEGIDPSKMNVVSVAVGNTSGGVVGVLARIEPNVQAQMFRVTIRSSSATASKGICATVSAALKAA